MPSHPAQQSLQAHIGRVPDAVYQLLIDVDHKEEQEDDQHEQRADHSPRDLPEDVGLVANHKLDVLIEPGRGGQKEAISWWTSWTFNATKAEGRPASPYGHAVPPYSAAPSFAITALAVLWAKARFHGKPPGSGSLAGGLWKPPSMEPQPRCSDLWAHTAWEATFANKGQNFRGKWRKEPQRTSSVGQWP